MKIKKSKIQIVYKLAMLCALFAPCLSWAGAADVDCKGASHGMNIRVMVHLDDILDFGSGSGILYLNNKEAARFDAEEVKLNILTRTMSGSNVDGISFHAHLTNLDQGYGILDSLQAPRYNMSISKLAMECWLKKE